MVIQSASTDQEGGQNTIVSWQRDDNNSYFISFNLACTLNACEYDSQSITVSYRIGDGTSGAWTPIAIGDSTHVNTYIGPNQRIEFKVYVPIEMQFGASPSITAFNYAVPAPLPAAGAATAFGYSRRLRRRIKGKVPSKHKQSSAPSYPGAYLNLPPLALQAIPLTFNYQARSVGRFSMVASASSSSGFTSH